jgi:hypothetical protein
MECQLGRRDAFGRADDVEILALTTERGGIDGVGHVLGRHGREGLLPLGHRRRLTARRRQKLVRPINRLVIHRHARVVGHAQQHTAIVGDQRRGPDMLADGAMIGEMRARAADVQGVAVALQIRRVCGAALNPRLDGALGVIHRAHAIHVRPSARLRGRRRQRPQHFDDGHPVIDSVNKTPLNATRRQAALARRVFSAAPIARQLDERVAALQD